MKNSHEIGQRIRKRKVFRDTIFLMLSNNSSEDKNNTFGVKVERIRLIFYRADNTVCFLIRKVLSPLSIFTQMVQVSVHERMI